MSRRAKAAVSLEEVRRLATLSKLTLTRSEEEQMKEDLSSILSYFKVVDGATGAPSPSRLKQEAALLRADEVRASDPDGALRGVRRRKGRLVRAPRVF